MLLTAVPIGARAETAPPGYTEAVTQALSELEANNYPEAREEFRRAHAIFPNARTLRGLGMVEFELRNYVQSVHFLEEALRSKVKPLEAKLRTDTEALLSRAQRYVGELVLDLEPSEASVSVDGAAVSADADGVVRLEVGAHTLMVQAPGRTTEKQTVQIEGGGRVDLTIRLTSVEEARVTSPAPAHGAARADTTPERRPAYKKWWVWATVAVVVAGGAATAAILLTRPEQEKSVPVDGTNTVGVSLQTLGRF